MNKKTRNNINSLIKLKKRQQSSAREVITKITEERRSKLDEINFIESQIQLKQEEYILRKKFFYVDTISNIFGCKDIQSFQIDLEKIDVESVEFSNQKESRIKELWAIDERLKQKQADLRFLIVKEEKYNYLNIEF